MRRVQRWVARAQGPHGWWARRWLFFAGNRADPVAIDAVWELWFDTPDPRLWAALTRWGRTHSESRLSRVALGMPTTVAAVVEAARRDGHPLAATARQVILDGPQDLVDAVCEAAISDTVLAAFCVEHQLAPSDPALFFLLTGQSERYRLSDPDHSVLALAYRAGSARERSRIRAAAASEPDLVRVLAQTVGGLARLDEREAEHLVDAFAGRGEWERVWQLAKDLPVLDAAAAVRRIDGWRPPGGSAPLFDALAGADPAELAASREDAVRPVRLPAPAISDGSLSPDWRRLALGVPGLVNVYTLDPPRHESQVRAGRPAQVLALADDVVIVSDWAEQPSDGPVLTPLSPGIWGFRQAAPGSLTRTADGFAAMTYDEQANTRRLHLLSGKGPDVDRYEHRILDLQPMLGTPAGALRTMAIHPESRRIAFAGRPGLHLAEITDDGLRRLASVPVVRGHVSGLTFSGPDRLLSTTSDWTLQLWKATEDGLRAVAERKIADTHAVDVPGAGVIAAMFWPEPSHREVRYLDRDTLADVHTPSELHRPDNCYHVFGSPEGDRLGIAYGEVAEVLDAALIALADRPLAATTPADLPVARTRLDRAPDSLFLRLLYESLAHRFEVEVALGSSGMITGRDGDIALGGHE